MRSAKIAFLAASLALLAGCGAPTPYEPITDGYGYAQREIETGRYRISFAGNSLTPRETVENYLLYRAAELTLETGNDWFTMGERETAPSTVYQTVSDGFPGPYYGRYGFQGPYEVFPTTSTSMPVTSYDAFATILVHKGTKPGGDIAAYDARDVLARLGPTIRRAPAEEREG